jgi:carboxyl-terminal processing protease
MIGSEASGATTGSTGASRTSATNGRGVLLRGLFFALLSSLVLATVFSMAARTRAQDRDANPGDGPAKDRDDDYVGLFRDVEGQLGQIYFDLDRVRPRPLVERALSQLELSADEIYIEALEESRPYVAMHVDDKVKVLNLNSLRTRRDSVELLESVFRFLERHYHGDSPLNDLRYTAVNGYLSGIDPHTVVFPPANFDEFRSHIDGEISGVGMLVGQNKLGRLQVSQVLPATPAERAGFHRADLIVKIGEESTINMTVQEAVDRIRGKRGTDVVLTVRRAKKDADGEFETIPITVTRDRVEIKSVESKLLDPETKELGAEKPLGGIGYVKVAQFDKNTTRALRENLARLERQNGGPLQGLVIDLRGNSGGLLNQAIAMSDTFLREGDIVVTATKNDQLERTAARNDRIEPDYPIILLSDRGSASGAEIVLGALQKNGRGLVLGTRSFGKGSVQQLHPLDYEAQLKITVSEYLIPGDISIQENGVVPDIEAEEAILDADYTDIFATEDEFGEQSYDTHIVSKYKKDEIARFRLRYLGASVPRDIDPDEPTERELFILGELRPEKDSLIRMAWSLFRYTTKPFRPSAIFADHGKELEALKAKFEDDIVARLAELGVDWSSAPEGATDTKPDDLALEVDHEFIEEPSKDPEDPISVPKLVVRARLSNKGATPAFRLKAIVRSDYYVLRDHEFLFGQVAPGETVERTRKIQLPYYPNRQKSLLSLDVSGPNLVTLISAEREIELRSRPEPAFAYSATLVGSDGQPRTKLDLGDDWVLEVDIRNIGGGTAHKGVAILRNETGPEVFLKNGRIEFTALEPESSTKLRFQFDTRTVEQPKEGIGAFFGSDTEPKPPSAVYEFELIVVDSHSNESISRRLSITRSGEKGPDFPNGELCRVPNVEFQIAATVEGKPTSDVLSTTASEVQLVAKVRADTDGVKAWVTSLPLSEKDRVPDKVYFQGSDGKQELDFKTTVPLLPGLNVISVTAKDQRGILGRRTVIVRRDNDSVVARP